MTAQDKVSDLDIMEANGAGMDAYSDGKSIHDNPYGQRDLRNAWHEGWRSAEQHREE
jgi:ribosome modulation factor